MRKNPHEPFKIDTIYGEPVDYGPHEGWDTNGLGGGNTDCNTELFPLIVGRSDAVFTSYSKYGYGRILVYEVQTPRGIRWIRYAHLNKVLVIAGDLLSEDRPVALMGSTGNSTFCHLHWDIFKKKPPTWRWWPKTKAIQAEYMIDPVEWFKAYGDYVPEVNESDLQEEKRLHEVTRQQVRDLRDDYRDLENVNRSIKSYFQSDKDNYQEYIESRIVQLAPDIKKYKDVKHEEIIRLEIDRLLTDEGYKAKWLDEVQARKDDYQTHQDELKSLRDEIKLLKDQQNKRLDNLSDKVEDKLEDTAKAQEKVAEAEEIAEAVVTRWHRFINWFINLIRRK